MDGSPQMVLRVAAFVCFALCVILAFLAIMLYRRDRIREVMDDLSGKTRLSPAVRGDLSNRSLRQLRTIRQQEEKALRDGAYSTGGSLSETPVGEASTSGDLLPMQPASSPYSVGTGQPDASASRSYRVGSAVQPRTVSGRPSDGFQVVKSCVSILAAELVEID